MVRNMYGVISRARIETGRDNIHDGHWLFGMEVLAKVGAFVPR